MGFEGEKGGYVDRRVGCSVGRVWRTSMLGMELDFDVSAKNEVIEHKPPSRLMTSQIRAFSTG